MSLRILAFVAVLSIATAANASPVHYVVSSALTPDPDKAHFKAQPLPSVTENAFLESTLDATLDHQTGLVTVNQWNVFGPGGVVYSVPSFTTQLTITGVNDYEGTNSLGTIAFWPLNVHGHGWLLSINFAPQPSVDVALLPAFPSLKPWSLRSITIQTPEPAACVLAMMPLALACRRLKRLA